MFDNKYGTNFDLLFKEELEIIKRKENIMMILLEQKTLNSIVNKIIKAIENNNKFIYRAPLIQKIGVKIYNILN